MNPYPAYKPSGAEWLGDVPAHWDVRRLGSGGNWQTLSLSLWATRWTATLPKHRN